LLLQRCPSACKCLSAEQDDPETQIRQISVVLTKEKSKNWKTQESGNIQNESGSAKTRASDSVLQAALTVARLSNLTGTFAASSVLITLDFVSLIGLRSVFHTIWP
jgi:hypothetical protein